MFNIQGYLDRGYNAVKIKVGQDRLADDGALVAAVRELQQLVLENHPARALHEPGIGVSFDWDKLSTRGFTHVTG